MPYLTRQALKNAVARLDEARRTQRCDKPRTDADGKAAFVGVGGTAVPYGVHGAAFLEIDPESGDIRCAACVTGSPTAIPKEIVMRGKREHAVSVTASQRSR